ncbi:MAG: glycoside hydrolase family 13 protein [Betaproteobacteria bacterium]|nr:MAG: glycoside hydrolase family 13 protein [Betaproteobacteria bacterium]
MLVGCSSAPSQLAAQTTSITPTSPACTPSPLGKRPLYLRGSFNSWNANEEQRFTYRCNQFELTTTIKGDHRFKLGDETWSPDADLGAKDNAQQSPFTLIAKGSDMGYQFSGTHQLKYTPATQMLTIDKCPDAPFGNATLYLRGSMNNWAALDDYAFKFNCDAYYLNVNLSGRQEFKIADPAWSDAATLSAAAGASTALFEQPFTMKRNSDPGASENAAFLFSGEATIKLVVQNGKPVLTIGPKLFEDPSRVPVTDPVALSVGFDSRSLKHKSPFGAITAGSGVEFALASKPGVTKATLAIEKRRLEGNQEVLEYLEPIRVAMQFNGERWVAKHRFADLGVYGYYFEIVIGGNTFIYANNNDSVYWTREKGSGGVGEIIEAPAQSTTIRRFRQTVFDANFKVPEWAPDIVYYYIFPDRFRNGNRANDPKPGVDTYQNYGVEFHSNWNEKPYRPNTGDGSDGVFNNDFFGGDIAGIIEKLDYIKDLGANTLYITPMFQAPSNHKYDTADFKNIDPHFGSNDDFVRLTAEAAKRGIRVIPDTSLNHVGADSTYFDRYSKYQSKGAFEGNRINDESPYASWFSFDRTQSDPAKQFRGWTGILDLPELNKSSPSFRKFAYGDADSVMKLWLDRGAAGWRMDVAPWVPDDFWREWRRAVKAHRPDALTVAETWFDSSKYFLGDTFDSTMNYIFRNTVQDYAMGGKAAKLYQNIELMREAYPPQSFYALMNLLSSHDAARSLHQFGFHDGADAATIALAKQRLQLAVLFQMTFPGAPTVYYGDEVGVTGGDDPYNRATYPWADTGGKPDTALLAQFKQLIKLRNDHPVLRRGSIEAPIYIDDNVIVLVRKHNDTVAIVATNNATSAKQISVTLPNERRTFTDALNSNAAKLSFIDGRITLDIPPLLGRVLVSQ